MSKLIEFLSRIKKKEMPLKIYAMTIRGYGFNRLVLRSGYSVDEIQKNETQILMDDVKKAFPDKEIYSGNFSVSYVSADPMALIAEHIDFSFNRVGADKNEIMKVIIEKNDKALYEKNLELFSLSEKRYIEDRLKGR